jgi:hypothetical protein
MHVVFRDNFMRTGAPLSAGNQQINKSKEKKQ